jgi:hypothetical protein
MIDMVFSGFSRERKKHSGTTHLIPTLYSHANRTYQNLKELGGITPPSSSSRSERPGNQALAHGHGLRRSIPPKRLLLDSDLIRFDDRCCGKEGGDFGKLLLQVGSVRPTGLRVGFGLP